MGLIKHNCYSGFPAQKLHFTRKTGRPRRTQHHVSTAAEACAASSSNGQTRSIINMGTPHRMAALHGKQPVPVVRRKEVADSRLSPGVSAGRSETAPGISTVTRSAKDIIRKGVHCIGWCFLCCIQQVRERQPELDTSDGSNFCYYPLCKLRLSCTGVTFGETSPRNVS